MDGRHFAVVFVAAMGWRLEQEFKTAEKTWAEKSENKAASFFMIASRPCLNTLISRVKWIEGGLVHSSSPPVKERKGASSHACVGARMAGVWVGQ